jgi:aryl-alcohol dehydrogenase-like predicted oxidoreductase
MEYAKVNGLNRQVSRIGLGTWSIGGWMWGGTDERNAPQTIRAALKHGINLIDTARPCTDLDNRRKSWVELWRDTQSGRK